jgi:serine/threonine protein kinase
LLFVALESMVARPSTLVVRDSQVPTVEGYEVLRRLGRGGMGEVLEAERVGPEGFRKRVALKQLALDLSIDRTAMSRFFQEARICARLEHPNIVRVQDLLTEGGRPFIVMELLRGLTLWDLCRALKGGIEWWVPFAVAEQVLAALIYAHAVTGDDGAPLGLVHRDLTPRNLMVTEDGVVKVLDFGIAKLTASFSTPALTADGSVAGTLEFFSPEQAQAVPLDARSDLFQLGGSMVWALTGLPPNGTGAPAEVLVRAVMGPGPKLRELRPDLPEAVVGFLERATARDRDQRFADARAMHAELRAVLATTVARGALELSALVRPLLAAAPSEPRAPTAKRSDELETVPSRPPTAARARAPVVEPVVAAEPEPSAPTSRRVVLTGVAASLAVGTGAFFGGRASVTAGPRPVRRPPEFSRLTWRQGTLFSARFISDDSYVASGAFGDEPTRTWLGMPGTPEGRELDFGASEVLAVSPQQELALLADVEQVDGFVRRGTLAQVMLSGGVPRDVLQDVQWADAHPETSSLAVVRWKGEQTTLEYPLDAVRRTLDSGWFGELRFSPNGRWLAFIVHPTRLDDSGALWLLDVTKDAPAKNLAGGWASLSGLAWRDSRTLWFTG